MDRTPAPPTPFSAPATTFPTLEGNRAPLYAEPFSDEPAETKRRRSTKRKQTLIQLLDELTSLKDDELDLDKEQDAPATQNVTERIKALPVIVDDRLQAEGAQLFNQFNKRIRQVDEQLLSFGNAVRPLGSSVGLISSAYHLRVRLQQILHLFRENAAECFPDKLKKEPVEPLKPLSSRKRSKARLAKFGHEPTRKIRPTAPLTSDLEEFPTQFVALAKDLMSFLHFLHDIPEFTDESLNASVLSFEGDLKYWASCLEEFEGQFGFPAVKRYVNDLAREMDEHLENIRDALKLFVQDGVNTIRTAQTHTQTGLQNLSTVATFFSGVTASTLQYTFDVHDTLSQKVVNALWISSLVFSIASSINSQLAYHWRAAMYRSPRNAVPWWVIIWLTRTPLIFLVFSVIMFSAGLVTFTYASDQGRLVSTCCTIFTTITSLALLAVGLWFAAERIVFSRTKGSRWLTDVLRDARKNFMHRTGITWVADVPTKKLKRAATWSSEKLSRASTMAYEAGTNVLGRVSTTVLPPAGSSASGDSCEDRDEYVTDGGMLPVALNSPRSMHARRLSEASAGSAKSRRSLPSPIHPVIFEDQLPVSSPSDDMHSGPFGPPTPSTLLPMSPEEPASARSPTSPPISPAKALFRAQVQKVMRSQLLARPMKSPSLSFVPNTPRKSSTILSAPERKGSNTEEKFALRPSRLAVVIPKLKKLQPTQHLIEHSGLVRHLQFSPDGKWLATCSWDRTAIIWKVGEPFQPHKILAHPGAGFISQVAWSPDGGKYLLTKMHKAVKVWMADTGVLFKTINCDHHVDAVTWLPSGKAFASVEHDHIHIVDLQGTILDTHYFRQMQIHDVSFTPDEERMLLVGTLKFSKKGLQPSKSRAEKRILVYDLTDKKVENQVPVLENVRDVSIGSDGALALISYEDRAPPEVWAIDIVANEGRLRLLNTYMPTAPVDFAGPSYFGGVKDQFVICAGKKGDIHIWDRETGLLLHSLQGANIVDGGAEDLTGIAWNHHAPGQFMFASATHDGTVRIWTAQAPPETAPPSRAESPAPMGKMRSFNSGGISIAT